MKKEPSENTVKKAGTRFKPGVSGNPRGRPKGTFNKTTMAAQGLIQGKAKEITQKAIDLALSGDLQAINLLLTRLIPVAKELPLPVTIKAPTDTKGIPLFTGEVLKHVGAGTILPAQGESILRLVKSHLDAVELAELDERIQKLETKVK